MQTIADVKMLILDCMESAFAAGEVTASQQLGVNMSNAFKRDGVTIIQNQNVEVYARIMPTMVKALRVCDALESDSYHQLAAQADDLKARLRLPPPAEHAAYTNSDPLEACCSWFFENRINWKDMQELMKARYLAHVLERCPTKGDAARRLGVGSTYLSKLARPGVQ